MTRKRRVPSRAAFSAWPVPVRQHLVATYGPAVEIRRLGGMSEGRVYRVRFASCSVIAKASPSPREAMFYERFAEPLRRFGVPSPRLAWAAQVDGTNWLVLEDIPHQLPVPERGEWWPDPGMLAVLCRLHAASLDAPAETSELYSPQWTDEMTDAALSVVPAEVAAELESDLRAMQVAGQHLFASRCWISGDPNPANWGMRTGGELVLYDWERFGRGTPALDLAICVPGLGDDRTYVRLAQLYAVEWRNTIGAQPLSVRELARDIAIAKIWSVAEFLGSFAGGGANIPEAMIDRLLDVVPHWVGSTRRSELLFPHAAVGRPTETARTPAATPRTERRQRRLRSG